MQQNQVEIIDFHLFCPYFICIFIHIIKKYIIKTFNDIKNYFIKIYFYKNISLIKLYLNKNL